MSGVPPTRELRDRITANLEVVSERMARAALRVGRAPQAVTLVAVSKTLPAEAVLAAWEAGVRHVGENRIQEAEVKVPVVRAAGAAPTWHLVGHLQTNKVRAALHLFDVIQSVDSSRLARTLARQAVRPVPVLIEVNVGEEPTKSGFWLREEADLPPGAESLFGHIEDLRALPQLDMRGLMTVAPVAAQPEDVRPIFRRLRTLAEQFGLVELSMGMTDDFEVAIEEGATIVRIGRAIFGERMQST